MMRVSGRRLCTSSANVWKSPTTCCGDLPAAIAQVVESDVDGAGDVAAVGAALSLCDWEASGQPGCHTAQDVGHVLVSFAFQERGRDRSAVSAAADHGDRLWGVDPAANFLVLPPRGP